MLRVTAGLLALTATLISTRLVGAADAESVVDRSTELELVSSDFEMADGPCWDGWSLIVPDVKGEKVVRYVPRKQQVQSLASDAGRISASFFNHGRVFLSDNGSGELAFLDGANKRSIVSFESLQNDPSGKPYRPNDLVVDNQGGAYVTFTPQGQVVYVSPAGELSVAVASIDTPNGITLSPDGGTLYVASFVPKQIWAYDVVAPGKTNRGRMIATMDDGPERGADGMAVDRAGNIYCAGPSDIWIWSPSGRLLDKIVCPSKPINCAFGDQDMRSLYITAATGLYRQRMRVSGCSPRPASLKLQPPAERIAERDPSIPDTTIPNDIVAHLDLVYAQDAERKLLADLFAPRQRVVGERLPPIVVVHGGGWHNGDKTRFQSLAIRLAGKGFVVASIEYRLAGEAAFPAAIHDCTAAVRFLRANADRFQIDPNRIGAVGGSAGGHLVGLMASGGGNPELQGNGGNADQSSRIQAAIVMAGPMEMLTGSVAERSRSGRGFSNANSWLRGTVDEKPQLYRLADAYVQIDRETCPILFMVGEHDQPSRNQPSRDKLASLGIETGVKIYKDGEHGCWNRLPWLDQMVIDMNEFFSKHLRQPSSD